MNYLSVGNDAKTVKGQKLGFLTGILYMAPHTIAGGKSLCLFSTAGCRAVCLYTAGRGGFNSVQQARIRKTREFLYNQKNFLKLLTEDITALIAKGVRDGMTPAVRLNGTTDIEWEKLGIMEQFPGLQFYDYTKWPPSKRLKLPANYHLTYSFSEKPNADVYAIAWRARGCNTAAVFAGGLPKTFLGRPVIDGDLTDLRFTDPTGVIVGLKTKGKARGVVDAGTGFVQKGI